MSLLKKKRDLIFSIISLIISIFWSLFAFSYPRDSSAFPRILCVVLILLSLIMFYKSLQTDVNRHPTDENFIIFSKKNVLFYLLCGLYILALTKIGFYVASYFFVLGICIFLKYQNKAVIFVWPAVLCLLLYLVFSCFLHVPTPEGILF
ncbi:tripartite tricarboxylate transporter TctB family protein [Cloacibacillus porcorum]|uniref:tripartite tricarboxylate transporter TctB family protein n=1 Tax=Cloacibacillus porcorum TaxID=1197717 RepID=UPI00389AC6B1